ncbi:protein C19orf12 homolog [Anopheles ziemanni]|uniref:protein C19orf12 homolog n=1 Tax=Anopheles coustani TaxID=139045 RepID=UPI0026596FB1|nr:protein C19orf12 homolog [Anopheles coustani]XP_058176074.1 protein C19orf12 homolog [Anopheles ziemanni]
MPIDTRKLFVAVGELMDKEGVRVAIKSSAKGAAIAGSSSFIGGLVAGPIGLFAGGAVGGLLAYAMTNDQFKPLSHVIQHDLSVREQERLKKLIVEALSEFDATDLMVILPLLTGNVSAQKAVLQTVVSFVTNDMRLQIID